MTGLRMGVMMRSEENRGRRATAAATRARVLRTGCGTTGRASARGSAGAAAPAAHTAAAEVVGREAEAFHSGAALSASPQS